MPINGDVLQWAIEQGGYDVASFATALYSSSTPVTAFEVQQWIDQEKKPSKPELVRVAELLKRPTALFFRRTLPPGDPQPNLREARGASGRALLPVERVDVRWVLRLQETAAGALKDASYRPQLPRVNGDAEEAASELRQTLQRTVADQARWKDSREAFLEWRSATEALGVFIIQLEFGPQGIRGFSAWDDSRPSLR